MRTRANADRTRSNSQLQCTAETSGAKALAATKNIGRRANPAKAATGEN
jgi:hypothetical protein